MRVRIEFDMKQPTEAYLSAKEIMSVVIKGQRLSCHVTANGDLLYQGRLDIPPQKLDMKMIIESVMQAYAKAR